MQRSGLNSAPERLIRPVGGCNRFIWIIVDECVQERVETSSSVERRFRISRDVIDALRSRRPQRTEKRSPSPSCRCAFDHGQGRAEVGGLCVEIQSRANILDN